MSFYHYELKLWPEEFQAVMDGIKNFEYRLNDREYKDWETLLLREWNPDTEQYTGRELAKGISYVLYGGKFGVPKEYCVMSLCDVKDMKGVKL